MDMKMDAARNGASEMERPLFSERHSSWTSGFIADESDELISRPERNVRATVSADADSSTLTAAIVSADNVTLVDVSGINFAGTSTVTTALDVTIQEQVLKLIRDLTQSRQLAVLLITHDMGVIAESADRVAVMYAGRLAELGPVRDVLTAPKHPYTKALLEAVPVPEALEFDE